jgi:serine/threonine protein kinase/tetratricopeptide (TPR) repeat protein
MSSSQTAALNAALAGRYTIERELGRGGMATVYLADDLKHHRQVAIKVLRPELATSIGSDRFLREIRTVARLNHPHILPLYDSGAAGEILYYVMPFVRGESLRHRLAREARLPVEDALTITRDVAAALDLAHAAGIVHRDVKPENILLHEGEAMVADFGIALAGHEATGGRITETGLLLGTPEYMSPEQAAGESALDARSDVYSLACVLYEMLAGEPPHHGPTLQATIARRLTDPAPAVRRRRAEVPSAVEQVLLTALATEPANRFPSAAAFAEALRERSVPSARPPTVAVLPFANLSADPENEFFADGITEDVIAQLSKIRGLRVISRTSVMPFKGRTQSLREIGAALAVTTVLEGSVRRAGDRVRIVAQLVDVHTDQHLWAETYDRRLTDIFVIQTDVALHIAAALRAELSRDERSRIRKEPTTDFEAYQLFLRGRQWFTRFTAEGFRTSVDFFRRAIARDPTYALAHAALALAHTEIGETGADRPDVAYPAAREAAARALTLDPELGEAHLALAYVTFVSEFDWDRAERGFRRALELTPGNPDVYELYARMCSALERFDEAIAMLRRANEMDPMVHRADLANAFLRAGVLDEAERQAAHVVELDPHYARGHATLAWAHVFQGRHDAGLRHMERAVALIPGDTQWLAQLGQIQGIMGRADEARAVLRQLEDLAQQQYVSPYHLAYVHTGLGEHDRAMDYLERAYADRAGAIYGIRGSFLFRSLHGHPRFTALLRRMNLA